MMGILPIVSPNSQLLKFLREPIAIGILPIKLFPLKLKYLRLKQFVKFVGIFPEKELLLRDSSCNFNN
jgi:hypothetical protein